MKKIIEKFIEVEDENINPINLIIAQNDNGELKIGSEEDFRSKHMKAFSPDGWLAVGIELVHLKILGSELYCNVGAGLPVENNSFPYKFLEQSELELINSLQK